MFGFILLWNSRKQTFVAKSTLEAENLAMFETCSGALGLSILLAELVATIKNQSTLNCENTMSINWAERSDSLR